MDKRKELGQQLVDFACDVRAVVRHHAADLIGDAFRMLGG
jgi:hypothetical protein